MAALSFKPRLFVYYLLLWVLPLSLFAPLSFAAQVIQLDPDDTFSVALKSHLDITQLNLAPATQIQALPLAQLQHQFHPLWNDELVINAKQNAVLLRFALKNPSQNPLELWLAIKANNNYHSQLAQMPLDSVLEPIRTSVFLEQQTLASSLAKHKQIHQLRIPAGQQQTYYLLLQAPSNTHFQFQLQNPQLSLQELVNSDQAINITLGALLFLAFINWGAARFAKDNWLRLHAWYLIFISLIQALFHGHLNYTFGFSLNFEYWLLSIAFIAANISLSLFCWSLYQQLGIQRPWRALTQISFIFAGLSFIATHIWQLDNDLQDFSLLLCVILFCLLNISLYRQSQDNFALSLALARLCAFVSFGLISLAVSLDIGSQVQELLTMLVLLLEACSVSVILYYRRFDQYRKQWHKNQSLLIEETQQKTQKDVLSRFSHDIRTPISGVTGMAELLGDTPLSGTQKDYVETIQSSAKLLLSMINGVLDNSLLDNNSEVKLAPFELGLMVDDTLRNYQSRAENEDIELITDISAELPEIVNGDATRIRQILAHLLIYAFSHTAKGEVIVSVKPHPQLAQDHVLFAVKDTGQGLSLEQQKALFEPDLGQQANMQSASFAIVKRLIEEMQGDIGVNSQPKQGCEIWFSLPLSSQTIERTDTDIEQALRQKRLLIVDDNMTFRKLIRQQGSSWGMQVFEAENGNEALALLRSKHNLEEHFDIVVVDHKMPGMSGLQLAGKIAEDEQLDPKPLLLMLTGLSKAPFSDTASAYGIRRILTKPVSGRVLKTTLAEEVLSQKASRLPKLRQANRSELSLQLAQQGLEVLVAEDNPVSQHIIQAMLKKLGVQASLAANGQQAIDMFCQQNFDLVLMDCEMPVLDGLEASRGIRSWEQYHKKNATPIIALTGHILAPQIQACLDAGMNAHLPKPLELAQLETSLLETLANKLKSNDPPKA